LLVETVAAFLGVAAFAVLFRVPVKSVVPAGLAGATSWGIYSALLETGMSRFAAGFASAATLSALAEWGAKRLRIPVSILVVPGIIPLVPGADAYFAVLAFVQGQDQEGLRIAVQTMLAALSVAAGIVTASTLVRSVRQRER
jgi:uncharacterized membrane protein YjjB (DUF3815 family)